MATRMFDRRPAAALADPHERVATIVARHGDLCCGSHANSPSARRRPRRRPACARDLHASRRLPRPGDGARLAEGRREARIAGGTARTGRCRGDDVGPRRRWPAVAQRSVEERFESSERVERSAEVHAAPQARRGAGADAQGARGSHTTRSASGWVDLHEGQSLHHRGPPSLHAVVRGARDGRGVRASRAHACTRSRRGRRAATRCSSSARTCATAPAAARPCARFTRRVCSSSPPSPRSPRCSSRRECGSSGCEAAAPAAGRSAGGPELIRWTTSRTSRNSSAGSTAASPRATRGAALAESASRLSTVRVNLRGWLEPAIQRLQSSDLAMGVHAATTGGGGRITSIAALSGSASAASARGPTAWRRRCCRTRSRRSEARRRWFRRPRTSTTATHTEWPGSRRAKRFGCRTCHTTNRVHPQEHRIPPPRPERVCEHKQFATSSRLKLARRPAGARRRRRPERRRHQRRGQHRTPVLKRAARHRGRHVRANSAMEQAASFRHKRKEQRDQSGDQDRDRHLAGADICVCSGRLCRHL